MSFYVSSLFMTRITPEREPMWWEERRSGQSESAEIDMPFSNPVMTDEWAAAEPEPLPAVAPQDASLAALREVKVSGMCKSVWFSPDGRMVAASGDAVLALYDMATGSRLPGPKDFPVNIARSQACPVVNGGKYGFCVGCENSGDVFYFTRPQKTEEPPELAWEVVGHKSPVIGMAFGADGTMVFICYRDGSARAYDTSSGAILHKIALARPAKAGGEGTKPKMTFDDKITAVACSVSGGDQLLACGRNDGVSILRASKKYAEDNQDDSVHQFAGFDSPVSALAFSADGAYKSGDGSRHVMLAAGVDSGDVRLYVQLDSRPLFLPTKANPGRVTALAFSHARAEPLVVVGWQSGQFLVYDAVSTAVITRFEHAGTNNGHAIAFSPSSSIVATGGGSGVHPVLHYAQPMELADARLAAAPPDGTAHDKWWREGSASNNIVAASAAAGRVAVGLDNAIVVYEVATGKQLCEIETKESLDKMQVSHGASLSLHAHLH
jgi:WD40 repeat protein